MGHFRSGHLLPIARSCFFAVLAATASGLGAGFEEPGRRRGSRTSPSIEGIRDNQLVGYGLVVGLRGTGDSSQTVFPAQTLVSALQRMGITVPQTGSNSASNMQVKNMAGGLCGGNAAAVQPARLQDGRDRLLGRRCAVARRRDPADDPALRAGWADLRAGAGSAGAGRVHGHVGRQLQAGEPSHHGADSRRSAGGAAGAVRS